MEADDLFANEVEIGGPVAREHLFVFGSVGAVADGGHVVRQRVKPDIDDMGFIAGDGDAPLEAGS